jgi:hypothetical protein
VGCGPIADVKWLKLGTTDRIMALRDELAMTAEGWVGGDRTWRRCKMRAELDIARYNELTTDMKAKVDKEGWYGLPNEKHKYPDYRLQLNDVENIQKPLVIVRSPKYAILKAFASILDKSWHRYMFPFGCYFITRNETIDNTLAHDETTKHVMYGNNGVRLEQQGAGRDPPRTDLVDEWVRDFAGTQPGQDMGVVINPCSVTAADILYLCNVRGYIDRLLYTLLVIDWAKEHGVNLLIHRRVQEGVRGDSRRDYDGDSNRGLSAMQQFISLEKHLFVFGCIHNHLETIRNNYNFVGGYWDDKIKQLKHIYESLQARFQITPGTLDAELRPFLVQEATPESKGRLATVFKNTSKVSERPRN